MLNGDRTVLLAGGLDRVGANIDVTEIYYIAQGQWAKYFKLPRPVYRSNMIKIGSR